MAANDININTAVAADNSNNNLSPKLRRPTWNQIVRGGESGPPQPHPIALAGDSPRSNSAAAVMESNWSASSSGVLGGEDGGAENGGGAGGRGGFTGDVGKRPAWKKPAADGVAHAVEAVDAVMMGAESWPALSGSTRVGRTPSSGTLKGSVDGSSSGQVDCH